MNTHRFLSVGSLLVVALLWMIPATPAVAQHRGHHYDSHYGGRYSLARESIRYRGRPVHYAFRRHYLGGHHYSYGCRPISIVQQKPVLLRPRPRREIEMVPTRVAPRKPTQRAIIDRFTLADGTVRTIIRSVPIESTGNEAITKTAVARESVALRDADG